LSVADVSNEYFYVEIKAKGRMNDTLIGRLKVSCAELPEIETEMTLKVITESGEDGGEIHIVISLKKNSTLYSPSTQQASKAPEPARAPATVPTYTASYAAPPTQQYLAFQQNSNLAASAPVAQPAPTVQPAQPAQPAPNSPWRSTVHSATGKTFWYNTVTKETSWETPAGFAAVPAPAPIAYTAATPSPATYVSPGQYVRDLPAPAPHTYAYVQRIAPAPAPTPAPAPAAQSFAYSNSYSNANSSGQYVRDLPAPAPQTYTYAQYSASASAPAPAPAPAPVPTPAAPSYAYTNNSYSNQNSSAHGSQSSSYTQSYSTNYPGQSQSSGFESVGAYPTSCSTSSAFDSCGKYPGSSNPSGFGSVASYYPGQTSSTFGEPERNQQPQKTRFTCSTCTFEGVSYKSSGTINCEMCGASVLLGREQTAYVARVPRTQQASNPLPEFWEERVSNGRPYYVNHVTKTTTWTRPT